MYNITYYIFSYFTEVVIATNTGKYNMHLYLTRYV